MDKLLRKISEALAPQVPQHLGVAVSGGGDSVALLCVLHRISNALNVRLSAVTVDHRLRPEAASEAASVSALADRFGVSHDILVWDGWDGTGNTQNEARQARYRLMSEWAHRRGITTIALGHTRDDQAETVIMRLARSSGVDGLSAMQACFEREGLLWLRPFLDVSRAELRDFLRAEEVEWIEDPSNQDRKYDRIRVRDALSHLEPLGVTVDALAQVAQNMQSAREALDTQTVIAAKEMVVIRAGAVQIQWAQFVALPEEISRRLVVGALRWITGSPYSPRSRSIAAALNAIHADGSATLDGSRFLKQRESLWIFREWNAVKSLHCQIDTLWDGRWRFEKSFDSSSTEEDLMVAALGENGLAACPNWREIGLPRALLLATPAIWKKDELQAAPLAGKPAEWTARLEKGDASFIQGLMAH